MMMDKLYETISAEAKNAEKDGGNKSTPISDDDVQRIATAVIERLGKQGKQDPEPNPAPDPEPNPAPDPEPGNE